MILIYCANIQKHFDLVSAMTGAILQIVFLLAALPTAICSNYNFNVYNYDLNTPLFTPSGQLKQVEYASEASSHSHPMVILSQKLPKCSYTIMATKKQSTKAQSRIVSIPMSQSNKTPLLFGINGVLSDCVSLLQLARNELKTMKQYSGPSITLVKSSYLNPKSCAKRLATAIANKCQQHCFGGGIRPFGSEICICAIDQNGDIDLYVTEPSGSIVERFHREEYSHGVFVLGGEKRIRNGLQDLLARDEKDDGNEQDIDESNALRESIQSTMNAFRKVYKEEKEKLGEYEQSNEICDDIDIVVIHSELGVFRVTREMLEHRK